MDPRPNLRLVLLGGDCAYKNHVTEVILRSTFTNLTVNSKKGNLREGTVNGRQVSVFATPSYWMNHLASYWILSNGVESIRGEIQICTSLMFPGPHAFLLVMRAGHTSGKEHHLLRALTYMFGAEALQYTMVLFVHGDEVEDSDVLKNRCVKMCGKKYFNLENSDGNVEELFRRIEVMTQRTRSSFFIQCSYEKVMKVSFESWDRARVYKETQLRRELEEMKTERRLREDVFRTEPDTLLQAEKDLSEDLKASRHHESALQNDLDTARRSEEELRKRLEASRRRESVLQWDLEKAKRSEEQLRKEIDVLKARDTRRRCNSIEKMDMNKTNRK